MARAYVLADEVTGRPALSLTLSPESAKAFGEFTSANVGHRIELRIDGKVVMAPIVRDPILKGEVIVSGDFTRLELLEIANSVWSGKALVEVEAKGD